MTRKKLLLLFLLLCMSFSTAHGIIIVHEETHCDVSEFVEEFDHPTEHCDDADECDSHYIYHLSYILTPQTILSTKLTININPITLHSTNGKKLLIELFRPPILG